MKGSLEANLFPDAATPDMSVSVVLVSPYNTHCSEVPHCLVMLLDVTVVRGNARLNERNPTDYCFTLPHSFIFPQTSFFLF